MYNLTKSPKALLNIFTTLCLSQVKEQLNENLVFGVSNPPSFVYNGQLFSYIHNRSVILDESLSEYGIDLAVCHKWN